MNKAADNTDADVELSEDGYRFGFFTPLSYENKGVSASGVVTRDCGVDNEVHGDVADTALSPCY